MEYTTDIKGAECIVTMKGKFTFSDHLAIKSIIMTVTNENIKTLTLNFNEVEFVDSAALGMLLLLRDETTKLGAKLIISKPVKQAKKMFEVSRFYDLFTIIDE